MTGNTMAATAGKGRGSRLALALGRLAWIAIVVLGVARALGFLVYAFFELRTPLEAFHFEAVMVHHARRVAEGRPLYPRWDHLPYVANFYGPLAFWVVGLFGRATGAGIDGLFTIGRALSFGSAMAATAVVSGAVGRHYGRQAGGLAVVLSLGALPMLGFSVMVRPDLLAEALGFTGLVLALGGSMPALAAGAVLLGLAILAKQTAGMFLLAAAAALLVQKHARRAAGLFAASMVVAAAIALAVSAVSEPGLVSSLLGHSRLAPDPAHWLRVVVRLLTLAPDLVVFPVVGLALWLRGTPREPAVAAVVLTIALLSLAPAVHPGSDQNYVLSLRLAEALAVGKLRRAWLDGVAPRTLALAVVVCAASLVPGTWLMASEASRAWGMHRLLQSTHGRGMLGSLARTFRLAEDPQAHVLTDSGMVALHQGDRADYVDPWLFRRLVTAGRLDPREIRDRLATEWYDTIVTTSDVLSPGYDHYEFGLPPPLVAEVRRHYVAAGHQAGLFFYRRRGPAPTTPAR